MTEYERWLSVELDDPDLKEELLSVKDQPEEINDRFYRDLAFGTGGLRGVIGAGTNRMNVYTVRKATQGLANYLNKHNTEGKPLSVAIAHDSRNKGVLFCQQSAAVLAAKKAPRPWLIVNRLMPELVAAGEMYSAQVVAQTLDLQLMGEVPQDDMIYRALLKHMSPMEVDCEGRRALERIAKRMTGRR